MTIIYKGIRVRLYPTEEQEVFFNKTFGCCRFVYDKTLENCKQLYELTQHFPSGKERSANLVPLKEEYDFIAMEDLNVSGLLKNHKLAYSISDVRWSQLLSFIQYKCLWYGKEFKQVDRFYASSKICSECGTYHKDIVNSLSVREWTCPDCGTHYDRDANAARNILIQALSVGI